MTNRQTNLDDGTLLDWIEGTLSPDNHRAVTRELGRTPGLQARADAMRLDRFTLSALGDETAPAGLLDGVADLLEREMLVGGMEEDDFALAEPNEAEPVVLATIRPAWRISRSQMAMAAGLVLVVGASAWFGGMMFASGNRVPGPPTRLAQNTDEPTRPDNTLLAEATTDQPVNESRQSDVFEVESADIALAMGDAPSGSASGDGEISPERAAELLVSGRLIVRVRMADMSGLAWLDRLEDRGSIEIQRDIPAQLALAVEPRTQRAYERSAPRAMWASDSEPVLGPPPAFNLETPALPERVVASIVLLDMKGDPSTLDAALRSLRAQRGIVFASFEDAGEALPLLAEDPPSVESVLWWRLPPERWTPRALVPIVFEVLR